MGIKKDFEQFGLSRHKGRRMRFWLIGTTFAEIGMLVFNFYLAQIYFAITALFFSVFALRVFNRDAVRKRLYVSDILAAVLASGYALTAQWLGSSGWRFLLIVCSSVIIGPYLINITKKE